MSDRVIFVTNKFDRPTQEKLVNLVKQLKKARKEVSTHRRVLVVHNLSSVHHKAVLLEKIAVSYIILFSPHVTFVARDSFGTSC
jgi:hypothetical protein